LSIKKIHTALPIKLPTKQRQTLLVGDDTCFGCFCASSTSAVASFCTPPLEVALSALEVALVVLFGDGAVLVVSVLRFRAMLLKRQKELYQTTMTLLNYKINLLHME
jgi:hypothetical protein